MTGIILIWSIVKTLNFGQIQNLLQSDPEKFDNQRRRVIGLLIFWWRGWKIGPISGARLAAATPREGPTPVSALIHAATMVAAGVYMLCRVYFLFNGIDLFVISWIGGITALLAALIAIQQDDTEAHSRLFHGVAIGLHGHGGRFQRTARGHVSFGNPRVFQGTVVPRRGRSHSFAAP